MSQLCSISSTVCNPFSNEHSVEGSATKQLITRHEEVKTVVSKYDDLSNPPNLDVVQTCGIEGHGIQKLSWIVNHFDTLRPTQKLKSIIWIDGQLSLNGDGL